MPFSMLGQSSKAASANVVRPYTTSTTRGSKIYAQGLGSTGAAPPPTIPSLHTTTKRPSSRSTHNRLATSTSPYALGGRSFSLLASSASKHPLSCIPKHAKHAKYAPQYHGPFTYQTKRARSTIAELFRGNEEYMANMHKDNPGLLASLANEGQRPPFMLVDCSDSRVNEQGIFNAQPGTIFTAGNVANRFDEDDLNSNAVLSFAVETLKVKHVVVMGHYGCGGVAAAMMPSPLEQKPCSLQYESSEHPHPPSREQPQPRPADVAVQGWVAPIRWIYERSERPEIVAHREKHRDSPLTSLPMLHDPAFRALVEENVKSNVQKIANSAVIRELFAQAAHPPYYPPSPSPPPWEPTPSSPLAPPAPSSTQIPTPPFTPPTYPPAPHDSEIYIHGWVYDVETGQVSDLRVSVGPPGRDLPFSPFPVVASACKGRGSC